MITMEYFSQFDFIGMLEYFSIKDTYLFFKESTTRYGALNIVNDYCADRGMSLTHHSITELLYQEKGYIFQQFNFMVRELNRQVEIHKHDFKCDRRFSPETTDRILEYESLYRDAILRDISTALELIN